MRRRFGDQVYWVTVGWGQRSRAQVAAKVAEATMLITGDATQLPDPYAAGAHLGALLADARLPVLLVLDDVWEKSQLDPFLVGAPNCVRLITTRNTDALPRDAQRVLVDRLEPDQARVVLTDSLPLPGLPEELVAALIAACGRWALLLRLANRWIAEQAATDRDAVTHATALVKLLAAGPLAADRPGAAIDLEDRQARNSLVEASIQASLSLLPQPARAGFLELGAFPPDEPIPIRALVRVWGARAGMDEIAVRRLCADLQRLALATIDPSDGGAVLLHDVLHAYARGSLGADGNRQVNSDLAEAVEAELPVALAVDTAGAQKRAAWWTLDARDGYLLEHSVEILAAAGQTEQAAALAADLRFIAALTQWRGATAAIAALDLLARAGVPDAAARAADLTRIAHLLIPELPGNAVENTLLAYLQPLKSWKAQADDLAARPAACARLLSAWTVPDLPDPALIRTLISQQTGLLSAVVLAPDGSWFATGGRDGTVRIWDTATGTEIRTLTAPASDVRVVAVAPDGSWLATDGGWVVRKGNDRVRIWDTATGTELRTLAGRVNVVLAVAVTPDGSWLATGDVGHVRIWDTATGALIRTLPHAKGPSAMAVAPDGSWLATGYDEPIGTGRGDWSVLIWDTATGELSRKLTGHAHGVTAMAVAPDGSWLATGSRDGTVRIWDPATGTEIRTLTSDVEAVTAMAVAPDGGWLATGGDDGTVRIWDPATGTEVCNLTGHTSQVHTVAVAPDNSWLVTGDAASTVRVWDLTTDPQLRAPTRGADPMHAVVCSPDGSWLATWGRDETVRIWDPATGTEIRNWTLSTSWSHAISWSLAMAVARDGRWLATGGGDGTVQIWDPTTGAKIHAMTSHTSGLTMMAMAMAPDGTWLAAKSERMTVRIWNPATGTEIRALNDYTGGVTAMAVAPDGSWLATGGRDGTVRIWDPATGTEIRTLTSDVEAVTAMAVAPDGGWLATGGRDGTVRIWDPVAGTLTRSLTDRSIRVTALAVAPNGSWLATASSDRTVRIWDTQGCCVSAIAADGNISALAWGSVLAAVGANGLYGYHFAPAEAV